ALSVQKRYISNEDLPVISSDSTNKHDVISEQISTYPEINLLDGDVKQSANDPYSIFNVQYKPVTSGGDKGITDFAIETCLDHGEGRLRTNFVKNHTKLESQSLGYVHVQLIPSARMQIHSGSVVAEKGGVVFNVDGEYLLTNTTGVDSLYLNYNGNKISIPFTSSDYPDGKYAYGAHSQLAEVAKSPSGSIAGIA
ncbi:hypothetical protein, partial [Facilibium subflavum]|uniref:hypothetical protein n=1 Tax=Facilibium subflavum TaxID=2219058 RepID=UPI001AAD9AC9